MGGADRRAQVLDLWRGRSLCLNGQGWADYVVVFYVYTRVENLFYITVSVRSIFS